MMRSNLSVPQKAELILLPPPLTRTQLDLLFIFNHLGQWYDELKAADRKKVDYWLDTGDSRLVSPMILELFSYKLKDDGRIIPFKGVE